MKRADKDSETYLGKMIATVVGSQYHDDEARTGSAVGAMEDVLNHLRAIKPL